MVASQEYGVLLCNIINTVIIKKHRCSAFLIDLENVLGTGVQTNGFTASSSKLPRFSRPFLIHRNSIMSPIFGGIKQNKKIFIHPSNLMSFLLHYFPKPRSLIRISIYREMA